MKNGKEKNSLNVWKLDNCRKSIQKYYMCTTNKTDGYGMESIDDIEN